MSEPKHTVIKLIGLGGGGQNAVDRMIRLGIEGIDFVAANTDAQALLKSLAPTRLQLGPLYTRGLGAGGRPEKGEEAAFESRADIKEALAGADMVFLTAGMGGGTGTGAIAVAAQVAKELGALTVAIVTTPFTFEGTRRMQNAEWGLERLRPYCDTLIPVYNDKLLPLVGSKASLEVALQFADEVLRQGVQGIAELVNRPGLINVDFSNIRALMKFTGNAMMAIGQGEGSAKVLAAARQALAMPLLEIDSFEAARGLLVHITGGEDLALFEVNAAMDEIQKAAPNAELVHGITLDPQFTSRAQVILVATGLGGPKLNQAIAAASDIVIQRPAPKAEAPLHLAEALFQQAVGAAPGPDGVNPWVASPTPRRDLNDIDLPAFLRKRRGLREIEKGVPS